MIEQQVPSRGNMPDTFWSIPEAQLLAALRSSSQGLSGDAVAASLERYGQNVLGERPRSDIPALLLRQFCSPIILILTVAAAISFLLHDPTDGAIILVIVLVSGLLGFWQERGAANAVEKLLALVELKSTVQRDGREAQVPVSLLVPGDVVLLSAGSGIPADCRVLEARELFVDQAALTGETYPVEKRPGIAAAEAPLGARENALFLGTHVVSGSGRAVVVRTGRLTAFGSIAGRLRLKRPETEFERGVRRFGYLLLEVTLLLVIAIFAFNVYLERSVLESFLFALALAVGLTPQLLPAIVSVNLARGARRMAAHKVIVKRLPAIENFGSMGVLCSDKTGTLTEGRIRVHAALGVESQESERVLFYACLNASFETAFSNPIDEAIRAHGGPSLEGWRKLDELPYDFSRKRLSVLASDGTRTVLVTKGALQSVLEACTSAQPSDAAPLPIERFRASIERLHAELSVQGYRTIGVAVRTMASAGPIAREDEQDMTFLGMLALADPPRPGVEATVDALRRLGVRLKLITGDNALVARHVAAQVGLDASRMLTGPELARLSDTALPLRARDTDVFAEVEPNQKERIIRALRHAGEVVGYMGDGINDAPALHAADVGISVQGAVDVAREAADIVLLEPDLAVLEAGVREGRRTFANTLKYVFMATSANFGNMFSMAGVSLFLSFLPLLPKQVLFTNLLTDIPELAIATDRVDQHWIGQPHRWDVKFIRDFMITFGLVSSIFDYLTFGVLLLLLRAGPDEFRTGWFVESVVSAALIVLVVRTRGPMLGDPPSWQLIAATLAVVCVTLSIPYTPLSGVLGFVPLPPLFLAMLAGITLLYIASAEMVKRWFYARVRSSRS